MLNHGQAGLRLTNNVFPTTRPAGLTPQEAI